MAALALSDGGVEVTSDAIAELLKNSNNEVAPYWPSLFAGLLKDGRCEELALTACAGAGGGPAVAAGAEETEEAAAPAAAPKEEEVDALEGGMDMFGGGDGGDY
eukprot:489748_1